MVNLTAGVRWRGSRERIGVPSGVSQIHATSKTRAFRYEIVSGIIGFGRSLSHDQRKLDRGLRSPLGSGLENLPSKLTGKQVDQRQSLPALPIGLWRALNYL